jgi:hypothetical protein
VGKAHGLGGLAWTVETESSGRVFFLEDGICMKEQTSQDGRIFVETMVLLLRSAPTLDEIKSVLGDFKINKVRNQGIDTWEHCGPALFLEYREEYFGQYVIDIVDRPWPDELDYDKPDTKLHKAWREGCFGISTCPGALERAAEQSWVWPEGREQIKQAKAFLRVRTTFMLDRDEEFEEDDWIPEDYDAPEELMEIHTIVSALFNLPQVICYFNPQGEVLRDAKSFEEADDLYYDNELPALELWCNVRLFRVNEEWTMMDTVGNSQIGVPDLEAVFFADAYSPAEVDELLRLTTMCFLENPDFDGESMQDEKGTTWKMTHHADSICDPPRQVVRLIPDDSRKVPEEVST